MLIGSGFAKFYSEHLSVLRGVGVVALWLLNLYRERVRVLVEAPFRGIGRAVASKTEHDDRLAAYVKGNIYRLLLYIIFWTVETIYFGLIGGLQIGSFLCVVSAFIPHTARDLGRAFLSGLTIGFTSGVIGRFFSLKGIIDRLWSEADY